MYPLLLLFEKPNLINFNNNACKHPFIFLIYIRINDIDPTIPFYLVWSLAEGHMIYMYCVSKYTVNGILQSTIIFRKYIFCESV